MSLQLDILSQYESYSGQLVNFEKSSIFLSPQLEPCMRQILLDILGVNVMRKSDTYLGRNLLLPSSRISSFDTLLDRCKKKLSAWKSHSLSHAGRMVLLKSSIASIPIYTMGTNLLPKGVTTKLAQLQRRFWWGGTQDARKMHLIGWERVSAPKTIGGLGFRDPELVNYSLVSKLAWRFLTENDAIWCQLLKAKYLRTTAFWDAGKPAVCSHIWRSILQCKDYLKTGCCWTVGNGRNIHVWNDPWVATLPGFRVTGRTECRELVSWVNDLLMPNTNLWNMPLVHQIFLHHEAIAISRLTPQADNGDDKLLWLPIDSGAFSAKSMYKQLTILQPTSSTAVTSTLSTFSWSKLWSVKGISPRVLLFLWRALRGGIAVGSRLHRIFNSNGLCKNCSTSVETIDHAFLHCVHARTVWNNYKVKLPDRFENYTLHQFFSLLLLHAERDQFRRACAIIWTLWKARNKLLFTDKKTNLESLCKQAELIFTEYKDPPHMNSLDTPEDMVNSLTHSDHHWELPPAGFVKINVDGACGHGKDAAGAIVRDHQGRFLGCASKALDMVTPIQAEAEAFLLGLQLIGELNLTNVLIEGDAKLMVDGINDCLSVIPWRIQPAVTKCRTFLHQRSDVTVSYAPRNSNSVAHALAKFSFTYDVTNFWSGGLPPPPLLDPLFADLAHIVTPVNQ